MRRFLYSPAILKTRVLTAGDFAILVGLAAVLYPAIRLAFRAPGVIQGPEITLSLWALPWYAFLSTARMATAYLLSLGFSLVYGYAASRRRKTERILLPLLDILQSVPILSFMPVALLSLSALLPQHVANELVVIFLIFTSQAWNMTFAFYQSLKTLPGELREAAATFRLDPWLRFKTLELPFAAIPLVWNSMMSWSGGWFFLMAAEIFHAGQRDFRMPGLGSYLQVAANRGDTRAILAALAVLITVIVLLDQLLWRPLLAWADRFKIEMVEGEELPRSWFFDLISRARLLNAFTARIGTPISERLDARLRRRSAGPAGAPDRAAPRRWPRLAMAGAGAAVGLLAAYVAVRAGQMLISIPLPLLRDVGLGTLATFLRVAIALAISLLWTVPLGVVIGTDRRLARVLQPLVQIAASIPATALFPILLLALLGLPLGLNIAAVLLMLLGSQWYLLFNVIAGAAAIPQELRDTTSLLGLSRWDRWRTLILPALFPFIVTGAITASGGAWNASIVAEQVVFAGKTHSIFGVGSLIARSTAAGNYPLLLASTLVLVMTVVLLNRRFWRRLYRLAEDRYRLD